MLGDALYRDIRLSGNRVRAPPESVHGEAARQGLGTKNTDAATRPGPARRARKAKLAYPDHAVGGPGAPDHQDRAGCCRPRLVAVPAAVRPALLGRGGGPEAARTGRGLRHRRLGLPGRHLRPRLPGVVDPAADPP